MENHSSFINKYKWIVIILVPLLFIIGSFLLLIPLQNNEDSQSISTENTPSPLPFPSDSLTDPEYKTAREDEIDPAVIQNAQKETLPDGSIKYILSSSTPQRPEIIIAQEDNLPVFKRLVLPNDLTLTLVSFTKLYGQARWVFKGSVFYGPEIRTHIYDNYGLALIVDPQTDRVLEQHTFYPMKVEDYIKKYGDDIPAQP